MSPRAARLTAHAKINLGLRILARETSGFHSIETIFTRIALGDLITVHVRGAGRMIDCRGADVGPPEHNLAYRAAIAFATATGWPPGFAIEIEKRVPVGGGLGGGSADAGAILRALAALAPRPVREEDLLGLAAQLGSDIPFLTSTAPLAIAWGRGEQMLALPPLPQRPVALVIPDFAVATADAYAWAAAIRAAPSPRPRLVDLQQLASWETIAPLTANDFEEPVAQHHPALRGLIDSMQRAGASIAHLSGSGSTVYGVFTHTPDPRSIDPGGNETVVLTHTLTHVSPPVLLD